LIFFKKIRVLRLYHKQQPPQKRRVFIEKTRVMVVRHALKGDGINAPKNHLSPQGEIDARNLGANLPASMKGIPTTHIGGSAHVRSLHTAMLIAMGAGANLLNVLPSQPALGSEEIFWRMTTPEKYSVALAEKDGFVMPAIRSILSPEDYHSLQYGMFRTVLFCADLGGGVILGTHSP
jgi:hypothetical protein